MRKKPDTKPREEIISDIKGAIQALRAQINPELVSGMQKIIEKQQAQTDIKIDKARNIEFVNAFLKTPAGEKLRSKISL